MYRMRSGVTNDVFARFSQESFPSFICNWPPFTRFPIFDCEVLTEPGSAFQAASRSVGSKWGGRPIHSALSSNPPGPGVLPIADELNPGELILRVLQREDLLEL